MNTSPAGRRSPVTDTDWYEIRLDGVLDPRWATRFDGMTLTTQDGTTVLTGAVDQAALHGQLHGLRDVGLRLVSVTRVEPVASLVSLESLESPMGDALSRPHDTTTFPGA